MDERVHVKTVAQAQKQILTVDKMEIHPIRPEEYPLLEDFLYDAIFLPDGVKEPPGEIVN